MLKITQLSFKIQLRAEMQTRTGEAFQELFSDLMERCHPRLFVRTCPWGNVGDRKNDGYLRSERMLFQVYAPHDLTLPKTLAKIEEDFHGALPHWKEFFDHWVFVHNVVRGLPSDILKSLLSLERDHTPINCPNWGYPELRDRLFTLNQKQIEELLGPPLSDDALSEVDFDDLRIVVETIASEQPPIIEEIRPVPSDKLVANGLSSDVAEFLTIGMRKADLVGRFFSRWHDATLGDRAAEAFHNRYLDLKRSGLLPDEIFTELLVFASGAIRRQPRHEAAVLAVLAYLFEQCEIFEEPQQRLVG